LNQLKRIVQQSQSSGLKQNPTLSTPVSIFIHHFRAIDMALLNPSISIKLAKPARLRWANSWIAIGA
jgi:glycerol uptake facilitator-like aquaporin